MMQSALLKRITSDQHKSDDNNRMIALSGGFFALLGQAIPDYNRRLIL